MDCRALSFRQLPHQAKLFLDYLDRFARVAPFYTHEPTAKSLLREAKALKFPKERANEVAAILRKQNTAFGSDGKTYENLDRLAKGATAVVSGQQVGLFGGPSYSIYKALMAVQIAQELTQEGIDAVPVFWMATEDHDLDEVRHTTWFHDGRSTRFELPVTADAGKPVGRIVLGPASAEPVREASDVLDQQGSPLLADILRDSYAPTETYGSAFAKLFARVLAGRGVILLDPLDADLHRLAAPIYERAAVQRDVLNESLLQRGKNLEKSGYAAQVKVTAKSTVLFYMGDGSRQVVTAAAAGFQAGSRTWSREEFSKMVLAEPQNISPNALFRPVVQDYLLPTVAYIGGAAEISYFAQSEVLYRELLGRMPVMLPRAGFTLIDVKAAKLLKQYNLAVEDVWRGSEEIRRQMERGAVPKVLAANFDRGQKHIAKTLVRLGKQIEKLDKTLQGSVETAQKKITFQLDKLRRKTGRAQDQKNAILSTHQQFLENLLYPHHGLQSRELNFLPFLARSGSTALDQLQKHSSLNKLGHHFIMPWP
ncbi:MAG: bacillithiol biosynthesis cysteine-adding enzyme BshC [Candidatus Acidiferrum sp.]|jgi:bacillithiol biosynthesis cysteine-adding enzyme BshC